MRELVGQDFDIDEDGVPRLHRGTRPDRILSVHDQEMRHGRKSQHQRFDGYKLSAAATDTAEPLITAVEVAPGRRAGRAAGAAADRAQPEARRPRRVLGDTAYGIGPVRADLAEREVDVLAPLPPGAAAKAGWPSATSRSTSPRHGDLPGRRRSAPIRHRAVRRAPRRFAKAGCDQCPLRDRCVTPRRGTKQVLLAPDEELLTRRPQSARRPAHRRTPAPHADRASNDCSACSPTATEPARAATAAAARPNYRPPGPPPWSTSTRSAATCPPTPPDQPAHRLDGPRHPRPGRAEHRKNTHGEATTDFFIAAT